MKKIAIITARSGSKGLHNKNILNLCGKPLIAWTIEAAIKSECFDKVIVSTDSEEYADISKNYGANVIMRGDALSNDNATSYMVVEDVINKTDDFDYFVLLQPTSPMRNDKHIKEAVSLFEKDYDNYDFLVSMKEAEHSSDLIKIIDDGSLRHFDLDYSNYRRQNYKEYTPNGAIYIAKKDRYLKQKHFFGEKSLAFIMSKEDSIDIDDKLDFELAIICMNKCLNGGGQRITARIKEKHAVFPVKDISKNSITLIGHSQFDKWNIKKLLGYDVINCGVNGISSFEYNELILANKIIDYSSDIFIINHGTNDIVYDYSYCEIAESINKCIKYIKDNNPNAAIFFILCSHVNGRLDRNNFEIIKFNEYLEKNLNKGVYLISLDEMNDKYGNLCQNYTDDGLHFNKNGYTKYQQIIEERLKSEGFKNV